jgi:hypothetical protein
LNIRWLCRFLIVRKRIEDCYRKKVHNVYACLPTVANIGRKGESKMKKKTVLLVLLLATAVVLPLLAIRAQGDVNAGPDQTVYEGQQVAFNGTTTANETSIASITWNFGDGSQFVNGSDPTLLNETVHTYASAGDYNVTLTVSYTSSTAENDTLTVTVLANLPPVADAGPDQIVEQTSPAGAEVVLNASGSSDPYNDTLTYNWTWTGGSAVGISPTVLFPAGTTNVTLTVSDGQFNATDTVEITVQDTIPPLVDAGEDVTVEQESPAGTQVTLNGTATDDADTELDYVWSENDTILGNAANLTYTFSWGTHVLTLNATDDAGNTGTDNVTVTVTDTTPPEITVTVTPDSLWPPNHKYVTVEATVTAQDAADPSPTITFVSITSNEPDNGKGDGNTVNDIVILGDFTFEFRAERSGTGEGRIYTITYQATDAHGNSAQAYATITVDHNQ